MVPDGVDEVDTDSAKDVPSFLRGAPPGDTAAKARKNLRRDIESKMEEGSLRFLAAFGVVDQVRITAILLGSHSSLAVIETRCSTNPHIGDACAVRGGTGAAAVDQRGLQIFARPRREFER